MRRFARRRAEYLGFDGEGGQSGVILGTPNVKSREREKSLGSIWMLSRLAVAASAMRIPTIFWKRSGERAHSTRAIVRFRRRPNFGRSTDEPTPVLRAQARGSGIGGFRNCAVSCCECLGLPPTVDSRARPYVGQRSIKILSSQLRSLL